MSGSRQETNETSRPSDGHRRARPLSPGWRSYCRECGWRTGYVALRCDACESRFPSLRQRIIWQAPVAAVVAVALIASLARLLQALP